MFFVFLVLNLFYKKGVQRFQGDPKFFQGVGDPVADYEWKPKELVIFHGSGVSGPPVSHSGSVYAILIIQFKSVGKENILDPGL